VACSDLSRASSYTTCPTSRHTVRQSRPRKHFCSSNCCQGDAVLLCLGTGLYKPGALEPGWCRMPLAVLVATGDHTHVSRSADPTDVPPAVITGRPPNKHPLARAARTRVQCAACQLPETAACYPGRALLCEALLNGLEVCHALCVHRHVQPAHNRRHQHLHLRLRISAVSALPQVSRLLSVPASKHKKADTSASGTMPNLTAPWPSLWSGTTCLSRSR